MNTNFKKTYKPIDVENGLQQQVDRLKSEIGKMDAEFTKQISILTNEINDLKRGNDNG